MKKIPMKKIDITGRSGERYMTRYVLFRLGRLCVYAHRFHASDPHEHFHDHPWSGLYFVLRGCYTEELEHTTRTVKYINYIKASRIHRIAHVQKNTLTLGVMLRKCDPRWYFYEQHGGKLHATKRGDRLSKVRIAQIARAKRI